MSATGSVQRKVKQTATDLIGKAGARGSAKQKGNVEDRHSKSHKTESTGATASGSQDNHSRERNLPVAGQETRFYKARTEKYLIGR